MREFPSQFSSQPEILSGDIGKLGSAALKSLNCRGYDIVVGLNEDFAEIISVTAQQPHIVEYCPGDATARRFINRESTERWLTKAGGRAVFLLLERIGVDRAIEHQLAGYAWTGREENPRFANYPVTSAYRLGDIALNKRLAADYIQAVVSATKRLFTAEGIGLETWQSNEHALATYERLNFSILEIGQEELRPTLQAASRQIPDKRIYMGYKGKP